MKPAEIGETSETQRLHERRIIVDEYELNWSNIKRELNDTGRNEAAHNCGAARRITMFARRFLAAIATVAYRSFCGDLFVVCMMIVVTGVVVMVATMIVMAGAGIFNLRIVLMYPALIRLARASMMETAPEYRVQQHRCDGEKFERGGHAEFS